MHPDSTARSAAASRLAAALAAAVFGFLAAGCATQAPPVYSQEKFDSVSRHGRSFGVSAAQTCEAARRALLGNGYLVQRSSAELVDGRKSFQPSVESHVEIEFHVVCAGEGPERSTIFVNALQDLFALKKTTGSASVGVGPMGSLSLPFGSSTDSLVRIASETIPAGDFYDRFFALVEHHLAQVEIEQADDPAKPASAAATPDALPDPAN